jgi:hypothetical protein
MELTQIQNYLFRDLEIEMAPVPFEVPGTPFFIRRQFDLYKISVLDKDLCLLISKKLNLSQHAFQEVISTFTFFQKIPGLVPAFVFSTMSKQERAELVRQKMAFLVPDSQMFIPSLGLDFSERIPQMTPAKEKQLRPAAQATVIQQILTGEINGLTVNQASVVMGYTAMGTLRAVNQLNDLGICKVSFDGYRKKIVFPSDRKVIWEKSKPFLRNPVKKTIPVEDDSMLTGFPLAGEFALSHYSDLSVTRKTYALHQKDVSKLLNEGKIQVAFAKDAGCADIQIWNYTLPSWNGEVDQFSLEMSFQNTNDARIKIAMLNLEEQRKW